LPNKIYYKLSKVLKSSIGAEKPILSLLKKIKKAHKRCVYGLLMDFGQSLAEKEGT
tara:strand:- start:449 stop:616 length:168 start_codon:yes stop_codon:yes gene_type:complete